MQNYLVEVPGKSHGLHCYAKPFIPLIRVTGIIFIDPLSMKRRTSVFVVNYYKTQMPLGVFVIRVADSFSDLSQWQAYTKPNSNRT